MEAGALAMIWLCRAQDVTDGGGVSAGYDLRSGWEPDFPETTGYIVPTFFDYTHFTGEVEYKKRALKMLNWLISVQSKDGSIHGVMPGAQYPIVFDTGQVLLGLVRGYHETKEEKYLEHAEKAGNWLVSIQDKDGKWSKNVYSGLVHTYNTRVAWSLLKLNEISPRKGYLDSAKKNVKWAIGQQQENGWFTQNIFEPGTAVITHAISYATRGILESGLILKNEDFIECAKKTADVLLKHQREDGFLPGHFDKNWNPISSYSCLTGYAQAIIIWLRLYQITHDPKYFTAAKLGNDFLIQTQERSLFFKSIHGAIKGSHPIHGDYLSHFYPNWATKFFIDALLLEMQLDNPIKRSQGI